MTCNFILSIFSGFQGIYDVEHFIKTLKYDVRIVESIPEIRKNGKVKKIKAKQVYIALAEFHHVLLGALMDF